MCVKISLFQAISDVSVYVKDAQELFLRKPRRKKKDTNTIHVIRKLADLMLGNIFIAMYAEPRIPIFSH
jgi:hypothetical protein